MSKHTRLVVSLLFIIFIVLAIAITRFYVSTPQSSSGNGNQGTVERLLDSDSDGNRIFEDKSGMRGIVDSSGRMIVAAEWLELDFAGNNRCIAAKRVGGQLMKGCIDYEGNVVVPLVYREITRIGSGEYEFYSAKAETDGSCVIYSKDFVPIFVNSWQSAEVSGSEIALSDGSGTFVYTFGPDGFALTEAQVSGEVLDCEFTLSVTDKALLAGLSPEKLRKMASLTGIWLDYAYTGSQGFYAAVDPNYWSGFSRLFGNDEKITARKLNSISGAGVRLIGLDDGIPRYSLKFSTDTQITYIDSEGESKTLRGAYPAEIMFRGSYDNSFTAVSGSFEAETPDYPETEIPPEEDSADDPTGTKTE